MQEIEIDIECYINFFLLNYINISTKERGSFIINENTNNIEQIVAFLKQKDVLFIGHNLIGYDNIMLNYLLKYVNALNAEKGLIVCKKLKEINDLIINKKHNDKWDSRLKDLITTKEFNFIDTLSIMNTVDRIGIKQASVNLKYHNVQDLPYEPDKFLTLTEQQEVIDYCFNDCEIGILLYESKRKDLELRKDVSDRYGLNVMNSNDTAIAKKILSKYYSEYTKLPEFDFKDLRSYNKPFFLEEIMPKITFKTKPFQDLYEWFKVQEITEKTEVELKEEESEEKKVKIKYDLKLPNITCRFALGGVHSIDLPGNFKSTNEYDIIDCDFSSWYPYLLLNYAVKPRHVLKEFLDIVKTLTEERIADKNAGRKKDASIKKIIINSIYGECYYSVKKYV